MRRIRPLHPVKDPLLRSFNVDETPIANFYVRQAVFLTHPTEDRALASTDVGTDFRGRGISFEEIYF
jgi:hypothetical protein